MPDEEHFLPLFQAAERYNLPYQRLYKLVERGHVAAKRSGRQLLVDLDSLEDFLPPAGWIYLADALKQFSMVESSLPNWVRQGKVKSRRRGRSLQVELASVQAAVETFYLAPPEDRVGWLTIQEAAHRMGVSVATVRGYIRSGWVQAKKRGKQWLIEESSARKKDAASIKAASRKNIPPGWISVSEAAQRMGLYAETLSIWIHKRGLAVRKVGYWHIVEVKALETIKFRWVRMRNGKEVARLEWQPDNGI